MCVLSKSKCEGKGFLKAVDERKREKDSVYVCVCVCVGVCMCVLGGGGGGAAEGKQIKNKGKKPQGLWGN